MVVHTTTVFIIIVGRIANVTTNHLSVATKNKDTRMTPPFKIKRGDPLKIVIIRIHGGKYG